MASHKTPANPCSLHDFDPGALRAALDCHEVPAGLDDRVLAQVDALREQARPVQAPRPGTPAKALRPPRLRAAGGSGRRARPASPRAGSLPGGFPAPDAAGALVSRRGLVLGGVAALAGLGALGWGLGFLRGGAPGSTTEPRFGLQVAWASEHDPAQVAFELEPTARGLMPVDTQATSTYLLMNLLAEGEGIESLVYRIDQTPTVATSVNAAVVDPGSGTGSVFQEQVERPAVAFCECKRRTSYMDPFYQQTFSSFEEAFTFQQSLTPPELFWGADAYTPDPQLEVDYAAGPVYYTPVFDESGSRVSPLAEFTVDAEQHAAGNDGVSPDGNPYLLCVTVPVDEFYASDPLLQLHREYQRASWLPEPAPSAENPGASDSLDASDQALRDLLASRGLPVGPGSAASQREAARLEAQGAFIDAFNQMRDAYPEAFYDWVRACYVTHMRLVAQVLSETVLTVEATFGDGATQRRDYRIDPVATFDEAVAQRFDGLLAYNGYELVEGVGIVDEDGRPFAVNSYDMLPFWDFVRGEPDPASPDPRLHLPLFSITDVT